MAHSNLFKLISVSVSMVKKKVKKKLAKVGKVKKPWFRKRDKNLKSRWGFIPINWKGWVALILLVGVNVFAANYFELSYLVLDSYLKFGVVFFLSLLVFILIARRKTRGNTDDI